MPVYISRPLRQRGNQERPIESGAAFAEALRRKQEENIQLLDMKSDDSEEDDND